MAERLREVAEIPQQFVKEGTLVSGPTTTLDSKLMGSSSTDVRNLLKMVSLSNSGAELGEGRRKSDMMTDDIEYLQLCRAIAVGFLVMGFIGYIVKLIHIPM